MTERRENEKREIVGKKRIERRGRERGLRKKSERREKGEK